jgi:hypothetical protein
MGPIRQIIAAIALLIGIAPAVAVAEGAPVVVELYTSQGCSSCPPADRLLGEIADRADVIALALHVDYWDYIGWKDRFADPKHTARQRAYARAQGHRTIYTPQMIVGGVDHVVGFKPMKLAEAIERHSRVGYPVKIRLIRRGDAVEIRAEGKSTPIAPLIVQVVTYSPAETVAIGRGENAGKTLTYHNIVRELKVVGKWNGQGGYAATVPLDHSGPVAAIVQHAGHGPILGAARLGH